MRFWIFLKNIWNFKKSSFLIVLVSLFLVTSHFGYLFYKKVDETKIGISSYIRQREYDLAENIFENKNQKATSDAFQVLKSFNVLAYEVYFSKNRMFSWPENSSEILASCDRPFESELTLRGIFLGPVKTCLSTTALMQGTFNTTAFMLVFAIVAVLFGIIAVHPLMGYKKSLNKTIELLKKWNANPSLDTPPKGDDLETNKIIELLSYGVESRIELKEVQTQLGMEKEMSRVIKQLAHDIRDPIYSLMANTKILSDVLEKSGDSQIKETILPVLKYSSSSIEGIVEELLETHRISGLNPAPDLVDVNPHRICQEIVESKKITNPEIFFEINASDSCMLSVNPKEFKRVILNIVNNSIESLDKSSKQILISIFENQNGKELIIEDNGKGISSIDLPKIFDEHFSKGKMNGNGLGLCYVKRKINSWGGNVDVRSSVGAGTRFKILFAKHKTSELGDV